MQRSFIRLLWGRHLDSLQEHHSALWVFLSFCWVLARYNKRVVGWGVGLIWLWNKEMEKKNMLNLWAWTRAGNENRRKHEGNTPKLPYKAMWQSNKWSLILTRAPQTQALNSFRRNPKQTLLSLRLHRKEFSGKGVIWGTKWPQSKQVFPPRMCLKTWLRHREADRGVWGKGQKESEPAWSDRSAVRRAWPTPPEIEVFVPIWSKVLAGVLLLLFHGFGLGLPWFSKWFDSLCLSRTLGDICGPYPIGGGNSAPVSISFPTFLSPSIVKSFIFPVSLQRKRELKVWGDNSSIREADSRTFWHCFCFPRICGGSSSAASLLPWVSQTWTPPPHKTIPWNVTSEVR